MSSLGIFIYGIVVAGIVMAALGLIVWGIANERRDRLVPGQGAAVFGEEEAEYVAAREQRPIVADRRQASVTDRRGRTREHPPGDPG